MTFINISNHPSVYWDEKQLSEAGQYGEIIDMPFPAISAMAGEEQIADLSGTFAEIIIEKYNPDDAVFHIMGELCFTFALVSRLQSKGYVCMASTTERIVEETFPGRKEVYFQFVKFREYLKNL
ncbi:MAG TPA: CRISPR-associated protein [Parabacteroides sp.]|nr:CRISPR-associated protein [Parabacteroides sp.]